MTAFIAALLMVVIAEMGDKTQLLAMAFATRFSAARVMLGVFVATILNHALAVLVGTYLAEAIPMNIVQLVAAISFVFFGLWTLRGDKLDGEEKAKSKYGPVVTVAIAFFMAEMGDKTQLATVALAAQYKSPLHVLLGTTIGMLIADGLGIIIGDYLSKRVSNNVIKIGAGAIFIVFGLVTLYEVLGHSTSTILVLLATAIVSTVIGTGLSRVTMQPKVPKNNSKRARGQGYHQRGSFNMEEVVSRAYRF